MRTFYEIESFRVYPKILFTKLLNPLVMVDKIPFSFDGGGLIIGIPPIPCG